MGDYQGQKTAGTVIKTVAPLLSAIPYVGPFVSLAAGIGGGLLEADAAKKQAEQGANERNQADNLMKAPARPEFRQKYNAEQALALGDAPGLEQYKEWLEGNMAAHIRTIKENSPNGASAANAISLLLGQTDQATNQLGADNIKYKASKTETALNDLWNTGLQEHGLEQERDAKKASMYQQANALETASTANKQTAVNTITGLVSSTATSLFNNIGRDNKDAMWQSYLQQIYGDGVSTPAVPVQAGTEANVSSAFNPADYIWNYSPNVGSVPATPAATF